MRWKPPSELYKENKITVKGKRHRFEYKCASCGRQFKKSDTQADHVIPSGSLRSFEDLSGFAERLFVEKEGYQILCNYKLEDKGKHGGIPSCHYSKTQEEKISRSGT